MRKLPLTRYVYGTTRLGDGSIPFDDRVAIARKAIDAGLALHTSHQYGDALKVLRTALDQDRSKVPPFIFKIGWSTPAEVRGQVEEQLTALGIDKMAVGQLCLGGDLAEQVAHHGPDIDALLKMKTEGLVQHFVLENWPWSTKGYLEALQNGEMDHIVDALIFYLNPLQRFVLNDVWTTLVDRSFPVVAMRTVCGGGRPADGYLQPRWDEMQPLVQASKCRSWTEFCVRFAFSHENVVATVGSTAKPEHLDLLIENAEDPVPLPDPIREEIAKLHLKWSKEHDRHAEPWSM